MAITESANKIITDLANRHLSEREKARVGAVASFALLNIKARLDRGEKIRNDGFFNTDANNRSVSDEILEGVLLRAKNEYEEKKIKLLGNFFANLAFSPEVPAGEAHHLLRVAEGLTYRQLCILEIVVAKKRIFADQ